MKNIYEDIHLAYLAAVDLTADLLDSIARYPAMWLLTVVATLVAVRMIYNIGYAMGQVAGL
jgi:hypothetical protein